MRHLIRGQHQTAATKFLLLSAIAILLLAIPMCAGQGAPMPCCNGSMVFSPRGNRMLGIDLLNTGALAFNDNLVEARQLQIDFIALHVTWTQIETSPGVYVDPNGAIAALNGVAAANGWKFSLTIRPIDLTGKTVPSDLNNTRFNNATMLHRFYAVIDFVMTKATPSNLLSIQIGNEIDAFNTDGEAPTFWSDYGVFLANCTNFIHANYTGVKVGFTGTFHGLVSGQLRDLGVWTAYAGVVDVIGVTYYPQNGTFAVHDPSVPFGDFQKLVEEFNGTAILRSKKIFLQEVGYQTSSLCDSSEEKQAAFFCNVFRAWDHFADRVPSLNILRLSDFSTAQAREAAAAYKLATPEFFAYLETLGLRRYNGTRKLAFDLVRNLTAARSWNGTSGVDYPIPQSENCSVANVVPNATSTPAPPNTTVAPEQTNATTQVPDVTTASPNTTTAVPANTTEVPSTSNVTDTPAPGGNSTTETPSATNVTTAVPEGNVTTVAPGASNETTVAPNSTTDIPSSTAHENTTAVPTDNTTAVPTTLTPAPNEATTPSPFPPPPTPHRFTPSPGASTTAIPNSTTATTTASPVTTIAPSTTEAATTTISTTTAAATTSALSTTSAQTTASAATTTAAPPSTTTAPSSTSTVSPETQRVFSVRLERAMTESTLKSELIALTGATDVVFVSGTPSNLNSGEVVSFYFSGTTASTASQNFAALTPAQLRAAGLESTAGSPPSTTAFTTDHIILASVFGGLAIVIIMILVCIVCRRKPRSVPTSASDLSNFQELQDAL